MKYKIVVAGASLGGLRALSVFLGGIPEEFPLPVVVVQHRDKDYNDMLEVYLQKFCALKVVEVSDKEEILPGYVYMAPPNYHLLVENSRFALSTEAPVQYSRPSIDVLFKSAADAYKGRVIGIILTGSGHDGVQGIIDIKRSGGLTLAQDPYTAECPEIILGAITSDAVEHIIPLKSMAAFLINICKIK